MVLCFKGIPSGFYDAVVAGSLAKRQSYGNMKLSVNMYYSHPLTRLMAIRLNVNSTTE